MLVAWRPRACLSGCENAGANRRVDTMRQEGVMKKRYRVTLTALEREDLRRLVSVCKAAAQKLVRARILLLADQAEGDSAKSDPEIVDALGCGRASVERVRKRFVEEGLEAALNPKPSQRVYQRKMD